MTGADPLAGPDEPNLPEFDDPPSDPLALLASWLDSAREAGSVVPQAMVLATCGPAGPATRTVSVKRCDHRGLVFSSSRTSRKARDLDHDPRAAGTFYWRETRQQINVAGRVEATSDAESDELFAARPDAARATAVVSEQSQPLNDESALLRAAGHVLLSGDASERPASWGGYLLVPDRIEFWQGDERRLHRRLEYRRDGVAWVPQRLQP